MAQRPGFPARMDWSARNTGTPKNIANSREQIKAIGQKDEKSGLAPAAQGHGLDSQAVRARMVRKLADEGLGHSDLIAALGAVERHRFVDSALVNQAYEDTSLPIGLGQTISKPSVVARMIELLLQGREEEQVRVGRVLEVGTGCGYQAAVLGRLVREVYSIERLRGLHDKARQNLRPFRLSNVHLLFGDGMQGYAKGAPYAGIIAAAGGNEIPQAWIDQVAVGGRIVAPMETASGQQVLVVVDKLEQGLKRSVLEAVHFVPLKSGIA